MQPHRHVVLFSFALLTISNSWMWITWSPITKDMEEIWGVSSPEVDALSIVFMYLYIPLSFPSLYLINNKIGMRNGLLLGAILNLVGAFIRWAGHSSYTWVYVGTVFCSIAQTFTLAIPPLLSHAHFKKEEYAMATSVGVLANQLGAAFGLGSTIVIDMTIAGALNGYLVVQFLFALVSAIMVYFFVTDGPADHGVGEGKAHTDEEEQLHIVTNTSPPAVRTSLNYKESTTRVLCDYKGGLVLTIVYGFVVGVYYGVATFLSQFVPMWKENTENGDVLVGYLGICFIVVGTLGSFVTGYILDRTGQYYAICRNILLGTIFFFIGFTYVVVEPTSVAAIFVLTGLIGFFFTAFLSVGFEYAAYLAAPANEAAVAGLLNASAQVGGCLYLFVGGAILNADTSPDTGEASKRGIFTVNLILGISLSLMVLLFLTMFEEGEGKKRFQPSPSRWSRKAPPTEYGTLNEEEAAAGGITKASEKDGTRKVLVYE